MDQRSLGLVVGLLEDRIAAIRKVHPRIEGGRGRQLVRLVDSMLLGVERERDRVLNELKTANGDEANVLGRKLLRLLSQVRGFSMLTPYLSDVGRVDLSMGLVQGVDILIESLLPNGADPVVHLDEHHMYSTLDLVSLTQPVRESLGVTDVPQPTPVVFFLPGTEPHNALLLPILAHEVGHAAVDQAGLINKVLDKADLTSLNNLLDECLTDSGTTDPTPWKIRLFQWIEELMCDALATALTGPSFLFASAVFLPAPEEGVLGTHPFPSDRVGMTIRLLTELGWREFLDAHAGAVTSWLEDLLQPIDKEVPLERFLREGFRILEPAMFKIASEHVTGSLAPDEFENIQSFLAELLHAGIPPSEIAGKAVPPWASVLAAWLHRIREQGDSPTTLVSAVVDAQFNASILKAIEMSRILDLWRSV